ncbi:MULTISPECIES: hypothetical protein [Bacteria]|uniref:arsenate reductase/protein-tyrosine-phosphatase family protein n=1 Tax=Bacteria TaxID=2 RepID=UPI003C7D98AF
MSDSSRRPLTRREWRHVHGATAETPVEGAAEEATSTVLPIASTGEATGQGQAAASRPSPSRDTGGDFSLATMFASADAEQPATLPTILTVCTGNICRSPLAATLLATRLSDLAVQVGSAGTQALVGHGMPEPARRIALLHGADPDLVTDHEARLLTEPRLHEADLVLAMTGEHRTFALHLAPSGLRRTFAVREFARLAATLEDKTLHEIVEGAGSAPRARLEAVVTAVADQRGTSPAAEGDEDVVDPYRRSFSVYEESAAQLVPALDEVERVIRAALG